MKTLFDWQAAFDFVQNHLESSSNHLLSAEDAQALIWEHEKKAIKGYFVPNKPVSKVPQPQPKSIKGKGKGGGKGHKGGGGGKSGGGSKGGKPAAAASQVLMLNTKGHNSEMKSKFAECMTKLPSFVYIKLILPTFVPCYQYIQVVFRFVRPALSTSKACCSCEVWRGWCKGLR